MGKISKAQNGVNKGYYKLYKDPQVSSDYIKQLPKKDSAKKPTKAVKKPVKRAVDLSAPGKGMIEELMKKGPMPASKKNVGKKGIKIKAKGGKQMMKRADGSTSQRGLWDNIRAAAKRNKAAGKPGKKPTAAMLKQERKIKAKGK
jgi:hypothetical protein